MRVMHFKTDSTISGAFQCSACSARAPPTCTSSIINFLGNEGPFSNEVGPPKVIWRNYHFLGCVGASQRLLQVISTIDGFTAVGAVLLFDLRFTVVTQWLLLIRCCTHGFKFIFGWIFVATHWCWLDLKTEKSSLSIRQNRQIYRHVQLRKNKKLAYKMFLTSAAQWKSYLEHIQSYINITRTGLYTLYQKIAKQHNQDENMWKEGNLDRFKHITSKKSLSNAINMWQKAQLEQVWTYHI